MSIEEVGKEPRPYEVDPEVEATSKLRARQHLVCALPHLISTGANEETVRKLVAWYERVVENGYEAVDPPIEGLDALVDELAMASVPHSVLVELARTRWAVRVAEVLVQWRQCLHMDGPGSTALAQATGRLEDIVEAGRTHIEASF